VIREVCDLDDIDVGTTWRWRIFWATGRRTGGGTSMARVVDADRLAGAGEIMSILRRRPSVRELASAQESGERPILVAAIDDPLQAVLDRIDAIGPP
jgi:hypothetical protein